MFKYKTLQNAIGKLQEIILDYKKKLKGTTLHSVFDIDDTLIFEDNKNGKKNDPIVSLLYFLKAQDPNFGVHLVTARLKNKEVGLWTKKQLQKTQIIYDSLSLAPEKHRESEEGIKQWKMEQRLKHNKDSSVVLFSVGDQIWDGINGAIVEYEGYPYLIFKIDVEKHGTKFFLKLPSL